MWKINHRSGGRVAIPQVSADDILFNAYTEPCILSPHSQHTQAEDQRGLKGSKLAKFEFES